MRMRVNLLGETTSSGGKPHIRALSESKAIATGANFLSEGFLFAVAVSLIMAESYRGYRKENKRRDVIGDRLDSLEDGMSATKFFLKTDGADLVVGRSGLQEQCQAILARLDQGHQQNQNVLRILDGVIDVGMKGGEMRRILAHDPQVAAALSKMEAEQTRLHTRIDAEKDVSADKSALATAPKDKESSSVVQPASHPATA